MLRAGFIFFGITPPPLSPLQTARAEVPAVRQKSERSERVGREGGVGRPPRGSSVLPASVLEARPLCGEVDGGGERGALSPPHSTVSRMLLA